MTTAITDAEVGVLRQVYLDEISWGIPHKGFYEFREIFYMVGEIKALFSAGPYKADPFGKDSGSLFDEAFTALLTLRNTEKLTKVQFAQWSWLEDSLRTNATTVYGGSLSDLGGYISPLCGWHHTFLDEQLKDTEKYLEAQEGDGPDEEIPTGYEFKMTPTADEEVATRMDMKLLSYLVMISM